MCFGETMTALPKRRSIRFKDYDYTTSGGYFIAICARDREALFDDERLRAIVETAWEDIPNHHANAEIDEFVVMPNHVHGVLFLGASDVEQPRAQRVAPLQRTGPLLAGGSLGAIVRAFKARVTRDVRAALGTDIIVWQRNYHKHVIRHEMALRRTRQYIVDNPVRWEFDQENPSGRPYPVEHDFAAWLNGKLNSGPDSQIGARP